MLSENIRAVRKAKGLSQEELAVRLHGVRHTVSKWEQGLSVPDADLLIRLSEELETPVSVLLGETVTEVRQDELAVIAEKLAEINKCMNSLQDTWQSDAAEDIRAAMNALKPRFDEYKGVVESYAKFLDTTALTYESTETSIQANANASTFK